MKSFANLKDYVITFSPTDVTHDIATTQQLINKTHMNFIQICMKGYNITYLFEFDVVEFD